jgi:hypothetical protein
LLILIGRNQKTAEKGSGNLKHIKKGEGKMKRFVMLAIIMGMLLSVAVNAQAALLGIQLGLPDIFSNTTGAYNYNAGTDFLSFSATPRTITFDGVNSADITGPRSYAAGFYVDSSGNLSEGASGNYLQISGNIDADGDGVNDYSGLLLLGQITDFGWLDVPGPYAMFDYKFDFIGGALSSFYAAASNHGGNVALSDISNFAGSWTANHSGTRVKHDTAPVPEPTSLLLLGSGLLGIASFLRKKKA